MKRRRLLNMTMMSVVAVALAFPAHAATDQPEGWTMSASAGLGYDSNVYDSPKTPYFDQALLVPAVVTPNVQSGVFVPLEFDARYLEDNMEFRYQFDGELYPSSKLSNANSYDHDVTLGWTRTLDGWFQGAELYGGLLGGYHRQIYYDRDTGTPKLSINSGTDISNRYTHMDIGGEVRVHKKSDDMEYTLEGKVVNLLYDDPVVMAPMDHTLLELGGSVRIPVGSYATKLKGGYKFAMRDYDARHAWNAQGVQSVTNPLLTYYYHTLNAQLFHKFGHSFMMFVDYWRTYRIDSFAKYNNYTKDRAKLRLRYHLSRDLLLRSVFTYTYKKYPNAFVFAIPGNVKKKFTKLGVTLQADYDPHINSMGAPTLWMKAHYYRQNSNDPRYTYNKVQAVIGGDWNF